MDDSYRILSTCNWFVENLKRYYSRILFSAFIECFKVMQNSLRDNNLISIIQAQITQCEKTIHYCRLKDRAEQVNNQYYSVFQSIIFQNTQTISI